MPPPRHRDDITAEQHLCRDLHAARKTAQLTQQAVADTMGVEYRAVHLIERRAHTAGGTSRCLTYARYARVVGQELAYVADGLPRVDSPHVRLLTGMAAGADTWAAHDAYRLEAFVAGLVAVREHAGQTVTGVARRRGVSYWSVERFEDGKCGPPMLSTLQDHVRALGGVLVPTLTPVAVGVAA